MSPTLIVLDVHIIASSFASNCSVALFTQINVFENGLAVGPGGPVGPTHPVIFTICTSLKCTSLQLSSSSSSG